METAELLERFKTDISNLQFYDLSIPDLYVTPYVICPTTLANQQYFLEYHWNNRAEKAFLSIYTVENSIKNYFVKNISLIPNIFIDKYIKNENWYGFLQFVNIDGGTDVSYTIKDISTKFKLIYGYVEE